MSSSTSAPILSIIVPVYNMSQTLKRCISFIINQTFKDYEAIFVDDCSDDDSSDIIHNYGKCNSDRIIYKKTDRRGGPGHARNIGISLSRGKYIGFIDADDWIDSNLYTTVISEIIKYNADMAIFGVKDEFECRLSSKPRYEYKSFNFIDNEYAIRALSRTYSNDTYISPMVCQKVYRKDFLTQHNLHFKENTCFEDDLFSFQAFLPNSQIIIVPGVFYHYYQRPNSITHSFSKKHIDDLTTFLTELKNTLIEKEYWNKYSADFYAFGQKCIINTINQLLYSEQDVSIQKNYISYLLNQLNGLFDICEWVEFWGMDLIRRFFDVYKIPTYLLNQKG